MARQELWAPENLDRVLGARHLFQSLARIYGQFPDTTCRQRNCCCRDSPPAFFVEYANMYRQIREVLPSLYQDLARRCLEYFFLSPVDATLRCPFLADGECLIYDSRPRVCRAYGLYAPGEDLVEGFRRLRESVTARQQVLTQAYAAYGIETSPREPLPLCPHVRSTDGGEVSLSREERRATRQHLVQLEARATRSRAGTVDQTFVPFTTHFAYTLFGPAEAQSLQIAVLQAYKRDPEGARVQVRSLL